MKKSQSALEFLVTYAWVFVVIAVIVGALYYFGIFDFGKYVPQKCTFTSQISCIDFALDSSQVKVKLLNNLGEKVTVSSATITNDANPPITCAAPSFAGTWEASRANDFTFTSCSGGAYLPKQKVDLRITVSYYSESTSTMPVHKVVGRINGIVKSG